LSVLLKPVELLYRGINRGRRALYRAGILRGRRLPRPVVSMGNRSVGGAGKTPTTIAVARMLSGSGIRVAVLTRGYGRSSDETGAVVGQSADTSIDAGRFGDEPLLIARSLPDVDVVVGADRHAAAGVYLRDHDCDLFLLDDGFQHLQLHRDVDIVIESAAKWYREGPSALADADMVLVRESEGSTSRHPERGGMGGRERRISTDPTGASEGGQRVGGERFRARLRPTAYVSGNDRLPLGALRDAKVYAFAGLADNEQFFAMLESLGVTLAGRRRFPDHHRYSKADLDAIRAAAAAAKALRIVTTEKDAVKLSDPSFLALAVAMEIEPEAAFRTRLLALIAAAENSAAP
jgi:tetraacyldisaccharide 4'-kinase